MPRKPRSRLRNVAEYVTVRAIEFSVALLPPRVALWLGRRMGSIARLFDRRHRVVAEQNAAWALDLGPEAAQRLVREVYRNVGATFVESLMLPHILARRKLTDFCQIHGAEHLRAALAQGRGAMVLTAHLGNWEFGGFALAHVAGSVLAVARGMDNPLLEANARRLRQRHGQTIVDRRGALRAIIRHLGQGGVVGMLIDQNQRQGGVFVDFFGKPASTAASPASIALKHNVPVLAGCTWRDGNRFAHHVHLDPPFDLIRTGDHDADVAANTALFTQRIEHYVRRHPGQWLWLHQRWRKQPPAGADTQPRAGATALPQEDP